MIFDFKSNGIQIKFEPADTDTEKRIIEQGILQLRSMIIRFNEVENRIKSLHPVEK